VSTLARVRTGALDDCLKQRFALYPASPATRDRFVEAMETLVVPAEAPLGARLGGAWFCHEEWFSQVVHVTEFDDLAAFGAWREAVRKDPQASKGRQRIAALAPEQREELLEPLGPIPAASLHAAIEAAGREPVGTYTFAVLEVAPGRMERFAALLAAAKDQLPIVACWCDVAGNPARVIDLWKGDTGRHGYRRSDARQNAFFDPLREIAPRERMMRLHPLPYSPLR
jgi:hypothetical protein